jgi:hypothetical protein
MFKTPYNNLVNSIIGLFLLSIGKLLLLKPPKIMKIDSIFVKFFYVILTVGSITMGVLLVGLSLLGIFKFVFNLFKK